MTDAETSNVYPINPEHAAELARMDAAVAQARDALGAADFDVVMAEARRTQCRQRLADLVDARTNRGAAIAALSGLDPGASGAWMVRDGAFVRVG